MAKLVLAKEYTYRGSLILVTPNLPLKCFPDMQDMQPVLEGGMTAEGKSVLEETGKYEVRQDILLQVQAASALQALLTDIGCKDEITAVSGYRTQDEQEKIWEDSMALNGEEFTRKFVAVPGHSEHQTGYAVDLAENAPEIDYICPEFPRMGICQRFRERMSCFGFVERYAAGKEAVTGIGAEPWHFRYVGYPHSVIMAGKGMVLEEYIGFLRKNTGWGYPYIFRDGENQIEISYIFAGNGSRKVLELPEQAKFWSSGTNEGGIVICRRQNLSAEEI